MFAAVLSFLENSRAGHHRAFADAHFAANECERSGLPADDAAALYPVTDIYRRDELAVQGNGRDPMFARVDFIQRDARQRRVSKCRQRTPVNAAC